MSGHSILTKILFVAIALGGLVLGFMMSPKQATVPAPASAPIVEVSHSSNLLGTRRPDFKLGSQTGAFVTAEDFSGKTVLFNFWATWCAPCVEEMPMLVELQSQYGDEGLQVVGIALDDVQKVRDFVEAFGITYPILVGSADVMETNQRYGNLSGALPYSVLVDAEGIIRWQYSGALQHDELVNVLQQWL